MKWISGPKQYLYFLESREPRFHSRMRPFFLFWPFSIWDSRRKKKKVSFLIAVYHSMVNGWLGDDVLKLTQKTVPFETCENERVLGSIWYLNSTLKTMFFKKFFQWGEKCLNLDLLIIAALKTQLHNFAFYFSGAQALLVVSHVQNRMKTSTVNLCLFPSAMNGNPWSFLYRIFFKTDYPLLSSFHEKHFKTKGGEKVILEFMDGYLSREQLAVLYLMVMCTYAL